MKKQIFLLTMMLWIAGTLYAQNGNDKISYQSVVRNAQNQLVHDTEVTVTVSIANSSSQAVVYRERHTVMTNANGLISFLIGDGQRLSGDWDDVRWNHALLTLETSIGGVVLATNTMPVSAVPYALYAKNADHTDSAEYADSTEYALYADSTDLDVVQNYLDENGYLPEEPQVLSIHGDTVFLTRGGHVVLPAMPTNVSAFTNDAGYLTEEAQVLRISNDTIYLTGGSFVKLPAGFSGDYNSLTNKPTNVSTFTNDAGYLTSDSAVIVNLNTNVTNLQGDVTNLQTNVTNLQNADNALSSRIATDSANLANNYYDKTQINDTLSHYLMKEVQVLSVSNDTLYLTGGSWVKLPQGFSGDYNDLTNKPTKSDLCDSVKPCVTDWISDSTRMVFDSLHNYYVTSSALKDTVSAIRGALQDTASAIRGTLIDTAAAIRSDIPDVSGFATKDELRADSTVLAQQIRTDSLALHTALIDTASAIRDALIDTAAAIRTAMPVVNDGTLTITVNGTNNTFTANQSGNTDVNIDLTPYATKIELHNDSVALGTAISDLTAKVATDSLALVNRIVSDSTVLADKMQADSLTLATRIVTDSTALVNRIVADSTALSHRMDTLLKHVCDSVKPCVTEWMNDTLKAYTTTNKIDTLIQKYGYVTTAHLNDTLNTVYDKIHTDSLTLVNRIVADSTVLADKMHADSLALVNRIVADSTALVNRIVADSTVLADKMHADSLALVNRIVSDSTALAGKMHADSLTLATRIVTDSTALVNRIVADSTILRTALKDTASAIRNSIGNGTLTIKQGENTLGTFNANQKEDASIDVPVPTTPNNGQITITRNNQSITNGIFTVDQSTNQTIDITVPTTVAELTDEASYAKVAANNNFTGNNTVPRGFVISGENATNSDNCNNIVVNACDLWAVFDSLTNKMNDILKTIDTLKKVNDSLAKEIESLKPSLTVTGPSDEQYLCGGSNTITFTASVTNANASDYTYSWTVNGAAQSSTDATLYYTPAATGEYKVICTATRSGYTPLKDSTSVNVSGGGYMPKFGICIEGRTVTVKITDNNLTTSVVWGDGAESVVTAGDSHEYANGNYTIIASSTAFGNCKLSWPITITETTYSPCTVTTPHTNTSIYTNTTGGLETVVDGKVVSVLDQEGNMYYVTQIGNQCWMRTNLRTSKYNDGSTIPGGENCTNYSITDPYHYINSSYDPSYGYFYNWSAASHKNNGNRLNLCPKGWHVPSQEEWAMLFSEAGVTTPKETGTGAVYLAGGCNWEGTTFGASSVTPNSYENQNRDKWGFTALPAGRAWVDNTNGLNLEFEEYGRGVYFWSSTEVDAQHAYDWYLGAGYPGAANESLDKVHGRLVRCLRDENDSPVTPTTSCTVTSVGTNEVGEGTEITAVKDYNDENSYSVMQIGSQCWMAENMRSTKYTDGTPVSAGIYAPNGNLGNVPEYGYLYNFAAAMHNSATSGAQGICPIGWHMPSKAELEIMLANGSFGTVAKAGLFAGLYAFFSEEADFWSTTQGSFSSYQCLRYGDNIFFEVEPENAVSVRCVRDGGPVIEPSLSLVASPDANSVTICSSTSTPAISEAYVVTYTATIENDNASEYTFKWTLDGNLYDGDNAGENAITLYWVSQGNHTVKCTATKGSTVLERTADLTVTLGIVPEFNIHHTTGLTVRLEIDPGYDVASIDWGDNSSEDVPANTGQVYHEYGAEGTYKVIVYSSVLCSDSAQVTVATTPTFACGTSTVSDYDGNEYNTVLIGSHCWMAENLRSTHYSDGTSITTCNSGTDGVTYKWAAAMNNSLTEGAQGACPEGWHVPTKDECQTMINNGSLPIAEFWTSTSSDEYEAYNCWVNGASGGFYAFDKQNDCSSVRCVRDAESGGETSQNPTVVTEDPTDVTSTSATLNATITPAGNETIMTRGFQLKVSGGDYDPLMFSGTDDVYSVTVDTLSAGVTYVYRAFISYGSSYTPAFGEEVEFTTLSPSPTTFACGTSTVSDADSNTYNTVQIGSQCWMKSNLRTTKYADGTSITNPGDTSIVSETTPYFYDYDYYWYNSQDYVPVPLEERGYYYNWVAVMKGSEMSNTNPSNVQGICPTDWHVPSRAEWVQLNNYLSSNSEYWCGDDPENVAKALSAATERWGGGSGCHVGDLTGNNSTQFTAFPTYSDLNLGGHCARFWTSMQNEGGDACYYLLAQNKSTLMRSYANIGSAYSVRCVKDEDGSAAQTPPSVTTGGPSGVSQTEATLNASLTNNDDVIITGRGFKYKASDEETYHDIYTSVGITESFTDFSISLDGLLPSKEYSYYAYVTYQGYTAVGTERTFVTASPATGFQCGTSEVQDVDGNHYHTVVIGSQCWLKENLRTVGSITNYKEDENFSNQAYYTTVPYYFQPTTTEFENFDLDYDFGTYGLYYNRIAALGGYEGNSSGDPVNPIQGVCPSGWHIPSKSEWEVLVSVINDEAGRLAGGTDWEGFDCRDDPAPRNGCFSSRDCYGFSALPAGWFDIAWEMIDDVYPPKEMACFWSSTVIPDQQYPETYVFQLFYDEVGVTLDKDYYDSYACPVRCVRDSE